MAIGIILPASQCQVQRPSTCSVLCGSKAAFSQMQSSWMSNEDSVPGCSSTASLAWKRFLAHQGGVGSFPGFLFPIPLLTLKMILALGHVFHLILGGAESFINSLKISVCSNYVAGYYRRCLCHRSKQNKAFTPMHAHSYMHAPPAKHTQPPQM